MLLFSALVKTHVYLSANVFWLSNFFLFAVTEVRKELAHFNFQTRFQRVQETF